MITNAIVFLIFLGIYMILRMIEKGAYKFHIPESPKETTVVDDFEQEALKVARVINRPMIEDWVEQLNASPNRPTITYWDFVPGSAEEIRFTLLNESTVRKGHLQFKQDRSTPRVSLMTYEDYDGTTKQFKGYLIKDYSTKQLISNLKADMSDNDKTGYIQDVATKALQKGTAVFDILKYENISKKEFSELWSKKKVSALCKMLVDEEIFASAKSKGENIIQVTPINIPDSSMLI